MYMTLIVIIDEHSQCLTENHYVGSMSDIKTICNVEPEVTLSIYEWCIDDYYYSVFILKMTHPIHFMIFLHHYLHCIMTGAL